MATTEGERAASERRILRVALGGLLVAGSIFAAAIVLSLRASEADVARGPMARLACVSSLMKKFDALAPAERRFSPTDFEKYSTRYCAAAMESGLALSGDVSRLKMLSKDIATAMLNSGEIHERQVAATAS